MRPGIFSYSPRGCERDQGIGADGMSKKHSIPWFATMAASHTKRPAKRHAQLTALPAFALLSFSDFRAMSSASFVCLGCKGRVLTCEIDLASMVESCNKITFFLSESGASSSPLCFLQSTVNEPAERAKCDWSPRSHAKIAYLRLFGRFAGTVDRAL